MSGFKHVQDPLRDGEMLHASAVAETIKHSHQQAEYSCPPSVLIGAGCFFNNARLNNNIK